MNEFNKGNMKWGGKVLFLFVWALLTIAVCCGIWNYIPFVALKIAAVALFGANAVEIIKLGKRISKE